MDFFPCFLLVPRYTSRPSTGDRYPSGHPLVDEDDEAGRLKPLLGSDPPLVTRFEETGSAILHWWPETKKRSAIAPAKRPWIEPKRQTGAIRWRQKLGGFFWKICL